MATLFIIAPNRKQLRCSPIDDELIVSYPFNGIQFNNNNEFLIFHNMDEYKNNYAKYKKSAPPKYMLYKR